MKGGYSPLSRINKLFCSVPVLYCGYMGEKDITCDLLRKKHENLSQQQETCTRLLVSAEFTEVFRLSEERRK